MPLMNYQMGNGPISKHIFVSQRVENVKNAVRTFRDSSLSAGIRQLLDGSGRINREFIHSFGSFKLGR